MAPLNLPSKVDSRSEPGPQPGGMRVHPGPRATGLAATFAVEISGVDLGKRLSDAELEAVRNLWLDAGVAVFRNQALDDAALVDFSARMGPLFVHVRSQFHSLDNPAVMMISSVDVPGRDYASLGRGELGWHTDQAYTKQPAFGTLLYGVEIPSEGGETEFSDLVAAQVGLPDDLRRRVAGRRAVYSIEATEKTQGITATDEQRRKAPSVSHPLLRRHPLSGACALYFSPDHALEIEGMEEPESMQLLAELTEWITQPGFRYAHHWRPGDVVMWDNARVVHRRASFPEGERRVLKRTGFMFPDALGTPCDAATPATPHEARHDRTSGVHGGGTRALPGNDQPGS